MAATRNCVSKCHKIMALRVYLRHVGHMQYDNVQRGTRLVWNPSSRDCWYNQLGVLLVLVTRLRLPISAQPRGATHNIFRTHSTNKKSSRVTRCSKRSPLPAHTVPPSLSPRLSRTIYEPLSTKSVVGDLSNEKSKTCTMVQEAHRGNTEHIQRPKLHLVCKSLSISERSSRSCFTV